MKCHKQKQGVCERDAYRVKKVCVYIGREVVLNRLLYLNSHFVPFDHILVQGPVMKM